jgi:hypothetical protein
MGGAGWGACSDGQTVNTRLPGDAACIRVSAYMSAMRCVTDLALL